MERKKIEILLVEDSLTQAEVLTYMLENNNYLVLHAINGQKAIDILAEFVPDIIISDIVMPGLDGYQFCAIVKADDHLKTIPVILLTSLSDQGDVMKGLASGADSFMVKPVNENYLNARIQYFIQNAELRKPQPVESDLEIVFENQKYSITSPPRQILDVLLSTHENSILKNEELLESNKKLKIVQDNLTRLNASLEQQVKQRTHELENSNNKLMDEIQERIQTEAALEQSQLLLKSSLESPNGMVIMSIDTNYRYFYFNKVHKAVMRLAYNTDLEIGMNSLECITSEADRKRAKTNYDRALSGESHSTIEEYGEEERSCYETFFYPIFNDKNEIVGITAFAMDITARKLLETTLLQSEAFHRIAIDNLSVPVFVGEIESAIVVYANQQAGDLMEIPCEEIIGRPAPDFYAFPEDRERVIEMIRTNGQVRNFELTLRTNKGQLRTGLLSVVRASFEGRQRLISTIMDITDRKKNEEDQRISAERFRIIFEKSPLGIALIDSLSGRIYEINEKYAEIVGRTQELMLKTDWMSMTHPEDLAKDIESMTLLNSGEIKGFRMNKRYLKPDGTNVWVNMSVAPIEVIVKTHPIHLCMIEDITERKNIESELIASKEEAEESNRLKSALLTNMSHEIRTPMNAIIGFSDLMSEAEGSEKNAFAAIVKKSSIQLLQLIDDVIQMSRLQSVKMPVKKSEFSPSDLIRDVSRLFNDPDLNKGLKIEINIPGQFSELIMLSDAKIISQVLTNLLSNAINYTSKGVVELGFDLHNELIEFYVKDTGIGIPYQEQQLIFETFYRGVYAISSAIRGTGLGLSISKKLVGLLNGKIGLTSTPNQGSRFYFTVPFIRGQQEDQKKSLLQPAPQNLKDISILIAEDEAINFQFLEVLLRGKVKKIDHAFNGKEAVEMAIKYNYNMILMDMKMPVMGGIEAIKILKLKFPDLPIIAQTAFVFPEDRENALQAGCDDFLSKPIKKEDLMVIITKYG